MWVAVAIFVVALLYMYMYSPKPKQENARAASLNDFSFPRAKQTDPWMYIKGTVRLKSPNTLWVGDFVPVPIVKKVSTGGFGGGKKKVIVGYRNYIGLDLALGLGPLRLKKIWAGKYVAWTGQQNVDGDIVINQPNLFGGDESQGGLQGTATFYTGTFTQAQDPYLVQKCHPECPRYGGLSHIVFKSFYIGTTTQLQAFNFELQGLTDVLHPGFGIMPNGLDQNPMEIIYDICVNKFARLGIDPNRIDLDNWREVAETLYAENLGASIQVTTPNAAKDCIRELLRLIDGVMYPDPETGKIKLKLIRQDYDPNTIPEFGMDDIESIDKFNKTMWSSTYNQCRVKFFNRALDYGDDMAIEQDFANINFQGRVRSTEVSMPNAYDAGVAQTTAVRTLSMYSVPLYSLEAVGKRSLSTLRPGDVFKLSWGPYNLVQIIMRLQKISTGTLTDGRVKIEAVQDRFATAMTTFAQPVPSQWEPVVTDPQPIVTRRVIEAPFWYQRMANLYVAAQGTLLALPKKPSDASISYTTQTKLNSAADTEYTNGVEDAPYPGAGVLTAPYSKDTGFATGFDGTGIVINNIDLKGNFITRTFGPVRQGLSMVLIDDELIGFAQVTDNGDGSMRLENLYRALLDTEYQDHAAGATVVFIDEATNVTETLYANTAAVRARHLDRTPKGVLGVDVATSDLVTLNQRAERPLPPDFLRINGARPGPVDIANGSTITLAWRTRNRLGSEIYFENEADQGAEVGTDYLPRYRMNGGSWVDLPATSSTSTSFTASVAGLLEVQVFSRRDGLQSWTPTYNYATIVEALAFFRITEDGNQRITEDGMNRILEA